MSAEKPIRPYGFCCVCAQKISVNIHGGATQHWAPDRSAFCSGSELGMDRSIQDRDHRIRNDPDWLARVKAEAWEEGRVAWRDYVWRREDADAAGQGVTVDDPVCPYRGSADASDIRGRLWPRPDKTDENTGGSDGRQG